MTPVESEKPQPPDPLRKKRLTKEERFKRLLGHVCAYCGRLKSERPPVWCVRAHEEWAASLREVRR